MKIAVIGCGAVGSIFAAHLARAAEAEVWAYDVWKEHIEAIRSNGLYISGASEFTARLNATSDPKSLPRCDYGIVATKAIHTRAAIAQAAHAFDENGAVCSVQNGVGNEEIIAEHVKYVIRGTTFPAGHPIAPGHIGFDIKGDTWIGPFEPTSTPYLKVEELASLMTRSGMNTIPLQDARGAQWTKLIFNASTNPVGALTLLHHGAATRFAPTGQLFNDLIAEGEAVAAKLGIKLHGDPRQLVQKGANATGKHRASMLQDVLAKRQTEVHETVAMAKTCEGAGFDAFWIAEAYPWWRKHGFEARSSTAILAVIAGQTRRMQLGWGIISPYTRHPVQVAMEARVMQDLAGDRFLLGLGASKIFMKEIGEGEGEKVGPATVMRESIEIVKGVLRGDPFEYQGKVFTASVPPLKPDMHASRKLPPIYVAGTGPVMQKMSGSISDGLLTASITTPAFVRYSLKNLNEGARKAGKNVSDLVLGSVIVGSIGRDSAKGKEGAREQAAMYLANKVQNIRRSADTLLECAGLTFEELQPVADAMEKGGRKAAAKAVTDEILCKVCAIAGTPDECIQRIEEYRAAGCTHIMLEIWGDDRTGQAKLFGEAVLPHFKK